jgi:hypothetical protein
LGDLAGIVGLLDNEVAGSLLHHRLDFVALVIGENHEAPRMGADALVFVNRKLDELVATQGRTFATEADHGISFAGPLSPRDRLVDFAKSRLVGRYASLELIVHGAILARAL